MRANEDMARGLRGMERSAGQMGRAAERTSNAIGEVAERSVGQAIDTAFDTGKAWIDMMLRMQRASLASLSVYSPRNETRISATRPMQGDNEAVVRVGEERLNVATRTLPGETTRIRRRVVETPVEQEVTLRDERVVVERRPGSQAGASRGDVLVETVVEMSDSRQVPQVWKSVHVAEEVVLRLEVTERTERVRETLKRDVVEVEQEKENGQDRPELARPAEQEVGRALAAGTAEAAAPQAEGEAARRRDQQQPAQGGRKP
jgi:stress response protein YsnF